VSFYAVLYLHYLCLFGSQVLISLAASSEADEEVAAIACYDIGEFVRNYPNGRAIVKRLGAKEIVMKLIEHDNPELQRHALQCVSKMLVNNWQVGTSSAWIIA